MNIDYKDDVQSTNDRTDEMKNSSIEIRKENEDENMKKKRKNNLPLKMKISYDEHFQMKAGEGELNYFDDDLFNDISTSSDSLYYNILKPIDKNLYMLRSNIKNSGIERYIINMIVTKANYFNPEKPIDADLHIINAVYLGDVTLEVLTYMSMNDAAPTEFLEALDMMNYVDDVIVNFRKNIDLSLIKESFTEGNVPQVSRVSENTLNAARNMYVYLFRCTRRTCSSQHVRFLILYLDHFFIIRR